MAKIAFSLKVAKSFILKMFYYKNGAMATTSGVASAGIVYYLDELLKNADAKDIILPFIVHVFGFLIYFFFTTIDLLTGLWNAKYQNSIAKNPKKNYVRSDKLWRTLIKGAVITVFAFMVMLICIFTEIIDGNYSYYFSLWALVTVWLMASSFEFHSIGENIGKRTGEVPPFFMFIEKITTAAQIGMIFRTKRIFANGIEKEKDAPVENPDEPIEDINPNNTENEKMD